MGFDSDTFSKNAQNNWKMKFGQKWGEKSKKGFRAHSSKGWQNAIWVGFGRTTKTHQWRPAEVGGGESRGDQVGGVCESARVCRSEECRAALGACGSDRLRECKYGIEACGGLKAQLQAAEWTGCLEGGRTRLRFGLVVWWPRWQNGASRAIASPRATELSTAVVGLSVTGCRTSFRSDLAWRSSTMYVCYQEPERIFWTCVSLWRGRPIDQLFWRTELGVCAAKSHTPLGQAWEFSGFRGGSWSKAWRGRAVTTVGCSGPSFTSEGLLVWLDVAPETRLSFSWTLVGGFFEITFIKNQFRPSGHEGVERRGCRCLGLLVFKCSDV